MLLSGVSRIASEFSGWCDRMFAMFETCSVVFLISWYVPYSSAAVHITSWKRSRYLLNSLWKFVAAFTSRPMNTCPSVIRPCAASCAFSAFSAWLLATVMAAASDGFTPDPVTCPAGSIASSRVTIIVLVFFISFIIMSLHHHAYLVCPLPAPEALVCHVAHIPVQQAPRGVVPHVFEAVVPERHAQDV